jgi:hypothetical protein
MNNRGVIIIGSVLILLSILSVVVFRVSGSKDSVYVDGCTPFNIRIEKGEELSTVNIHWKTKEKCTGYILYGVDSRNLDMVAVDLVNESSSKSHTVEITSLVSTQEYYFSVVSGDIDYGKDGLPLRFSVTSL